MTDEKAKKVDVKSVDEGAASLLKAVSEAGTLADRVKAFEAVTGWVELRHKIAPPKREPSKFERIKSRHKPGVGGALERRAGAAEAESGESGADLDDEDA